MISDKVLKAMAKKEIIEINLKHKEAEIKKRKAELEAYRLQ